MLDSEAVKKATEVFYDNTQLHADDRMRLAIQDFLKSTLKYCVWSNEHNAWWKPNHSGYTQSVEGAGLYPYDEAIDICNRANYGWDMDSIKRIPNELPIEVSIARKLTGGAWEGEI